MKKALAISLEFDIKTVKKVLVLMDMDVPSDEEIEKRFFNREPVKLDSEEVFGPSESLQVALAFMAVIMDKEEKEK